MEGIYLIYIREFINSQEHIYKIGESIDMDKQLRRYPNGSIVLFRMKCKESKKCKEYLNKIFKEKFIQKTYYGNDYFEGNEDEMINEIHKYLYIVNTLESNNNL
jgi:hypothetical protein